MNNHKILNMIKSYDNVLKRFPEVEKGEVKIEYHAAMKNGAFTAVIDIEEYESRGNLVRKPKMIVGPRFEDEMNKREQDAVLAHEFGHYIRDREYSTDQLIAQMARNRELNQWLDFEKNGSTPHRIKRLKKWYILHELYADKTAAQRGYKHSLLAFTKKQQKTNEEEIRRANKLLSDEFYEERAKKTLRRLQFTRENYSAKRLNLERTVLKEKYLKLAV
ncbi:MAG: hypothetical protein V1645_05260 [archaeon]